MSTPTCWPVARAAFTRASAWSIFPQLAWPAALRWKMCTGVPAAAPIRSASSIASSRRSPSLRMCVKYEPPLAPATFASSAISDSDP